MAADSAVLKIIVKECCRSLSYNDQERQFSFPLRPDLAAIWQRIMPQVQSLQPEFYRGDFNEALSQLDDLDSRVRRTDLPAIKDAQLLNGEVLRIALAGGEGAATLVKMKAGQYLHVDTGNGIVLGDEYEFATGKSLVTASGAGMGFCTGVSLLHPAPIHVALSRVFTSRYCTHAVAESIWPVYEAAATYVAGQCIDPPTEVVEQCQQLGIGVFPLTFILKGVCAPR